MSETLRERAKALMDLALQTPEGIKAEVTPQELLSLRSQCYAIRAIDRVFHHGKSPYNKLTFTIDFEGPKLVIRLKRGAIPGSRGAQSSNGVPAGTQSAVLRRGT